MMYIDSKYLNFDPNNNYSLKSRAQQIRDKIWMSMRGMVRRKKVYFGPNTVLVMCGTRQVHPLSVELVERLFGRRRMKYVLVGFEGRDCRADISKHDWWFRCFGKNAQFPIIVSEHCPYWIEKKNIVDAYSLLSPGGLFVRVGGGNRIRKSKPGTPPYMRGRFEFVDHALDMHVAIYKKL